MTSEQVSETAAEHELPSFVLLDGSGAHIARIFFRRLPTTSDEPGEIDPQRLAAFALDSFTWFGEDLPDSGDFDRDELRWYRRQQPPFAIELSTGECVTEAQFYAELAPRYQVRFDPLVSPPIRKTGVGRPSGSTTIRTPKQATRPVLLAPADGAMAGTVEAILAPIEAWKRGPLGRPEYPLTRGHISGSVAYIHPGDDRLSTHATGQRELDALCDALWADVAKLGTAELQLLMHVSNVWLGEAEPTDGFLISAAAYAEARGQKRAYAAARGSAERDRFNAMLSHLAHLDIDVRIDTRVKGKQRVTRAVSGRLVLAEAIGKTFSTPLAGFDGPSRADVTHWRLVPGTAWLASRALGQLGRYSPKLLALDPHNHDLRIRLGFFLGQQTAVRASSGTLPQPLSIAAILRGIGVPIPEDRRLLAKLRNRLEAEFEALQVEGVLTSWEWKREPERGRDGLANAAIGYVYHWDSVQEHAQHHPATRRALGTSAVRKLLPEGRKTSGAGDGN